MCLAVCVDVSVLVRTDAVILSSACVEVCLYMFSLYDHAVCGLGRLVYLWLLAPVCLSAVCKYRGLYSYVCLCL